MYTVQIIPYQAEYSHLAIADFEEVFLYSELQYSMRQLVSAGISRDSFEEALERAMQVCHHSGKCIDHHFRQIYVYDAATTTIDTDWLMSRRGVKLIIMQYPHLNKQLAQWLWEMSDR